ncbi:MAG TPA: tetratricopeptide repeat protein [Pseudomonadales bacterium]|nr:tetratricopeptide repeat protein [Pseudomonadales bacterium]
MADTEQEQIELLKKWWHENGKAIVMGVVVSLVAFLSWTTWQNHERAKNEAAADLYQQMLVASESVSSDGKVVELAEQLRKDYPNTAYAIFASLRLAKDAVVANDLSRAASLIDWAQNQRPDASLLPLIGLRLAQVQYAQGEFDKALASLSQIKPSDVWQAAIAELRGDILQSQNKFDEARDSYNIALKALEVTGDQERHAVVEIKLSGLVKPAAVGDHP